MTLTTSTDKHQERRLTARVEKEWRTSSQSCYPRRSDIDRLKFGNDWHCCFIVDLSESVMDSRIAYVGTTLKEEFGDLISERQRIGEIAEGSLLALAAKEIGKVKEQKQMVVKSGRAIHEEEDVLYRAILLPLSENGVIVDGVLGAVGYRKLVT
jgi:hypothetical protein